MVNMQKNKRKFNIKLILSNQEKAVLRSILIFHLESNRLMKSMNNSNKCHFHN